MSGFLYDVLWGLGKEILGGGDEEPDRSRTPYNMAQAAAEASSRITQEAKVSPRAGRYFTPGKTPDAGFPIRKQLPGIAALAYMDQDRLGDLLLQASLPVGTLRTPKAGLPTGSQSTVG